MAITGAWKERVGIQAGALKWGTGINPVHSINDRTGRDIAPGGSTPVDPALTVQYQNDGWVDEWQEEYHEGPRDIGMYDRPNYGDSPQNVRSDVGNFPQWGPYADGVPGGTAVRSEIHGMFDQQEPNQIPTETVSEGWRNKQHSDQPYDSQVSDISTVLVQTSFVQRDKIREGSQRGDGSASEYSAPIKQRIPGPRLKFWSGERRHEDMEPKTQTQVIRPFWNRTAGTGASAMMEPNAQTERSPLQRRVPADPYMGEAVVVDQPNYGYQEEDLIPYA